MKSSASCTPHDLQPNPAEPEPKRGGQIRKVGALPNMPQLPINPVSNDPRQIYPARFAHDFARKGVRDYSLQRMKRPIQDVAVFGADSRGRAAGG
jgi:hypothetical protein